MLICFYCYLGHQEHINSTTLNSYLLKVCPYLDFNLYKFSRLSVDQNIRSLVVCVYPNNWYLFGIRGRSLADLSTLPGYTVR